MRQWKCLKVFELTSGELSPVGEAFLTKKRIRRYPPSETLYIYETEVEAESVSDADQIAYDRLTELLRPYGVEFSVTESETSFTNWPSSGGR